MPDYISPDQLLSGDYKVLSGPQQAAQQPMTLDNLDLSRINSSLQGEDYLKQWPIEIQAATRAYMSGNSMPTGNPRQNGITNLVQNVVAPKMAMDLGNPDLANQSLYTQRRQMQTELGKTTQPQAVGGQITFGGTALDHLSKFANSLADLGNWNGLGITPLAHAANLLREGSTAQAGKIDQALGEAAHYGQEIAKFYGGGSSGEAERMRFSSGSQNVANMSGPELAGVIRAERDLIPARYDQIRQNIKNILGPEAADKALGRIDVDGYMTKINEALAKLDPNGPEAAKARQDTLLAQKPAQSAPPTGGLPPGWTVQVH